MAYSMEMNMGGMDMSSDGLLRDGLRTGSRVLIHHCRRAGVWAAVEWYQSIGCIAEVSTSLSALPESNLPQDVCV
jgi:hypothetical protein